MAPNQSSGVQRGQIRSLRGLDEYRYSDARGWTITFEYNLDSL